MINPVDTPKRIAFVLGALTGKELTAGNRDVSHVYWLLTNPYLGNCSSASPKPVHECRSRDEFQQALANTLSQWRGIDQLILYFTGHGKVINDIYCIQVGPSENDLLPFDNLLRDLKIKGVRRAILILDTCYSGAATKAKASEHLPLLDQYALPKGIAILASSRATETSRELPDGTSSVFTRLFCDGIEKGLDGNKTTDGYITIEDLVDFVKAKLESDEQYASFLQRPVYRVDEADRAIWISKNPSGAFTIQSPSSNPHIVQTIEDLEFLYEKTLPDKHPCANASLRDLNWSLVEEFLEKTYPEESRNQPKEEILETLKLFSPIPYQGKQVLHKSAVLCFARKPELFYEQAKSMFVIGNPGDTNFSREEITGPLVQQVTKLIELVKNNLRTISHIAEDGRRQERLEIDLNVVRELISNAITHRDYNVNGIVTVTLTNTALEIRSPGGFPPNTSWNVFLNSNRPVSCPVNVAISHYQSRLLVFEGIGRGFDIFKQYLKENGEDSITCELLPGAITLISVLRRALNQSPIETALSGDFRGAVVNLQTNTQLSTAYIPPPLPDQNTLPNPGPLPPSSRIPLSPNPVFTGRKDELRALATTLLPIASDGVRIAGEERSQLVVVSGIGGVGKTQLVVEFVHRYGRFFQGVHWVSMAVPEAVSGEVAACGMAMGLHPAFSELPLTDQVALTKRAWTGPEVRLIVFDSCDDPALLAEWRPAGVGVRLLVTSRVGWWPVEFGTTLLQSVEPLRPDESVEILRAYLGSGERSEMDADLRRVADAVGGLPLALGLAGHFLARYPEMSIDDYLTELVAAAELVPVGRGAVSATAHDLNVWSTFMTSFARLASDDPIDQMARVLLARAACFAPGESLPESLLRAAAVDEGGKPLTSSRDLTDAIASLVSAGLLEQPETGAVRLHRLLARFASTALADDRDKAQAAVERAVVRLSSEQTKAGDPRALRAWEIHLRFVTDAAFDRGSETAAALGSNLGVYLQMSGDLAEARPYLERALAISERTLGPEHLDTAHSLSNLGMLLQAQGDLAGARPYYERSLAIRERVLGPEHPDTALSLNNLGRLIQDMGDLSAARPYFEGALAINERVLGPEHPDTALSLNNLGNLLRTMGDLPAALPCFKRALAIREKVLGPEHPNTALSLNNLGALLALMGDVAEARPYYERALAINERALGPDHPDTATSLNNLGYILQTMGDIAGARPYYERTLAIRERILGSEHPDTAFSLNNLGLLLRVTGNYEEARSYYERALNILEKALGPDHPDVATILNNIGSLLQVMGNHDEAKKYIEKALFIAERTLGSEHPSTRNIRENLQISKQAPVYKDKEHQLLEERRVRLVEDLQTVYAQIQTLSEEAAKTRLQRRADAINQEIDGIDEEIRKFSENQEAFVYGVNSGSKNTINISGSQGVVVTGDHANIAQLLPTTESRQKLLDLITRNFNSDELHDLCINLSINYDELPQSNRSGKVRELILYMERRNRISELLETCKTNRPFVSWE